MKGGNLYLWFTHYKRQPGTDELGAPSPTFIPAGSYACGPMPLSLAQSGAEFLNAGHMLIRIDRQFETRFRGVKAEDRISVDGVMYDVLTVDDTKRDSCALKCKNSD